MSVGGRTGTTEQKKDAYLIQLAFFRPKAVVVAECAAVLVLFLNVLPNRAHNDLLVHGLPVKVLFRWVLDIRLPCFEVRE